MKFTLAYARDKNGLSTMVLSGVKIARKNMKSRALASRGSAQAISMKEFGANRMKDSYFQYALIVLIAILGCMVAGAVMYIGVLQVENEVLTQENQELKRAMDSINEEIRILSDRVEAITKDVNHSEDWNKETF